MWRNCRRGHAGLPILAVLAEQAAEPVSKDIDDVVTEIQNHRKFGADLDDGGKRRTGIRAQHQIAENTDMRAGGHREIFGQRLNDARMIAWKKFITPRDF